MNINQVLAQEFHLRQEQIDQTVALIDEGATIPFIARYRKERTGSLDDQVLREIFDRLNYLRNLEKAQGGDPGLHHRTGQDDGGACQSH